MKFSERYETKERIHSNERIEIYTALDLMTQKMVVIKALVNENPFEYDLLKFRKEYEILKKVEHDSVVQVLDYHEDRQVFLVLEYIDSSNLTSLVAKEGIQFDLFFEIASKCVRTLEHIHHFNVIHKDINPTNIMWDPKTKQLKLIDFNISEMVNHESQGFCSPSVLQGTMGYISPEQTGRMNRLIDYRTDFYSLGVMFYELLTGRKPFRSSDQLELIHSHIAVLPVPLFELDARIPEYLSDVVMKLLQKDANQRYQSESGILYDLVLCQDIIEKRKSEFDFLLASHDRTFQFVMSQEVYGRDDEIETLLSAYSVVHHGGSMSAFVAGYSGVGKTTVVQELFHPVVSSGGNFISGKFNQFKREVPYSAILDAFNKMIAIILSEDTENLEEWKKRIINEVGNSARILTELLPELTRIIGPQKPIEKLSGLEAQNRFNYVFHSFIRALASEDHPLVMFIDDLQWVDSASLSLIKMIIEDTELEYFFFVGAYRDNEVTMSHPLKMTITDVKAMGHDIQTMELGNLETGDLIDIVKDTFKGLTRSNEIVDIIYQKTMGNAFFAKQLINRMHLDKAIYYDHESNNWFIDKSQTASLQASSNVLNIITDSFKSLSMEGKNILSIAACLGQNISAIEISKLTNSGDLDISSKLNQAVVLGILTKSPSERYAFSHDKVQQAIYESVDEPQKRLIHKSIATLFFRQYEVHDSTDLIFDLLSHIEKSGDDIDMDMKNSLMELYHTAGVKALESSANLLGYAYLKMAVKHVPTNHWTVNYQFTLKLYNQLAEAAYLSTDFDYLKTLSQLIRKNTKDMTDNARIYDLEIRSCMSQNKHLEGVELALRSIKDFGVDIEISPSMEDAQNAFMRVGKLLSEFDDVSELSKLQTLENEDVKAVMEILAAIVPVIFNASPAHLPLVVCKMVELSILNGNGEHAPFGYALYALLLCGILGDLKLGTAFGDLAIDLIKQLDLQNQASKTYNMVGLHVMHFKDHLDRVIETLEMAYHKGLETGDHVFAGFAGHGYCINYYFSGRELNRSKKVFVDYTHSMENIKQGTQTTFQNAYTQAIDNLINELDEPWMFLGDYFNEDVLLKEIEARGHKTALLVTYYQKMYLAFIFGENTLAYAYARKVEANLDAGVGLMLIPNYYGFDSLIRVRCLLENEEVYDRDEELKTIRSNQEKLKLWSDMGYFNYRHRYLMVSGELNRLDGDLLQARAHYENALSIVKEAKYLNDEAIYREIIAEYYRYIKNDELSEYYLETAYVCYKKWGAHNKVIQLEKKFEGIGESIRIDKSVITIHETSSTKDLNMELDLRSILKASQAIAKEIVYESLLESMLDILIENAGAQRAIIVNYLEDGAIVGAKKEVNGRFEFNEELKDIKGMEIPGQVVNYVHNSKKAVLLRSAVSDGNFGNDPLIQNRKIRSLLCMPVIRRGIIIGIMYVENNLAEGVFTEQRVDILNMLSTQIAISLKNAMMYRHMEFLVKERTLELEKKNLTLERLNNQLQKISVTDGLTQLFNRRKIDEILYYENERFMRYGHPFSIILLDIDKFKNINDGYGHHVGDQVLIELSQLLKASIRKVDIVGRWGGEEFMIICPDTNLKQASTLAETIRVVVEAKRFGQIKSVTSSFGVAQMERSSDIETLIKRVDGLLYKAKDAGRNTVKF